MRMRPYEESLKLGYASNQSAKQAAQPFALRHGQGDAGCGCSNCHLFGRWTVADTITPIRRKSFEATAPNIKMPLPSGSFHRAAA